MRSRYYANESAIESCLEEIDELTKNYDEEHLTTMNWVIDGRVLYWTIRFYYERYNMPIMITENGMANTDWEALDGKVHDPQRIDFVNRYLLELERAMDDGIPVIGYQYWSIMDNYEWTNGYDKRFGLIYVDYRTQKRILKDSAFWYSEVIRTNGESLHKTKVPNSWSFDLRQKSRFEEKCASYIDDS